MIFSKKLAARIDNPKNYGWFTQEEATARQMRLVTGREGDASLGNLLCFYWLVDENDGVIVDVKCQVFGGPALMGAADATCELLLRKNYDQARRISAELIDKHLRDPSGERAFPEKSSSCLNLVISAIEDAVEKCMDIPYVEVYVAPPLSTEMGEGSVYPGWSALSIAQKIGVIEEVIANDIRPYIELDAGGVQVLNLVDDRELIIAYQGACTSCHSATGATLHAIQQILRAKVHPDLVVTPDISFLTQ
jgi:NifU-like protein